MKKIILMSLAFCIMAVAFSSTLSLAQGTKLSLPIPMVDKDHPYIKNNPQHPGRSVESVGNQLYNIDFLNDNTGFVSGVYGIWKTTNAGNIWTELLVEDIVFNDSSKWYWIDKFRIVDAQTMYAAGSKNTGPYGRAHVFVTHDGGSNWSQTDIHDSLWGITGLYCRNQNEVMITCGFGRAIRTFDGFSTWTMTDFFAATNYSVTGDMAVFHNKIFLSSFSDEDSTSFCLSSPNLHDWQFSSDMNIRYPIFIPHSQKLIVAGESGRTGQASLRISSDEGATWQDRTLPFQGAITCGVFVDNNIGYIGGYEMLPGIIVIARAFRTTNGGLNWTETVNSPYTHFTDICTTNSYIYYLGYGVIFRTGNLTGIITDPAKIPNDFTLKQNHPNPFNPSTKIEYSLPKNTLVTIKVFDMAGREVAILAHEIQAAGSHSIVFDAPTLTSGVYFYTLQADGFTATKKMMLVK